MSSHDPSQRPEPDAHALSGAYAVDAVDDLERVRFEAHLAECPACQEEVAGFREVAALLGSVADVDVPRQLRRRVLDDIRSVRPLPPRTAAPPPRSSARSTRRRPGRARLLLAAAAALAVVGGGTAVAVQQLGDDERTERAGLTADAALANRVVADPDARQVTVRFPDGATATAFLSPAEGRAALVTADMPAAPEGRDYQLWLGGADGELRSAGLMSDEPNQTVLFEGDATDATVAAVSVEPAGGSPAPSGRVVAEFSFEATT